MRLGARLATSGDGVEKSKLDVATGSGCCDGWPCSNPDCKRRDEDGSEEGSAAVATWDLGVDERTCHWGARVRQDWSLENRWHRALTKATFGGLRNVYRWSHEIPSLRMAIAAAGWPGMRLGVTKVRAMLLLLRAE